MKNENENVTRAEALENRYELFRKIFLIITFGHVALLVNVIAGMLRFLFPDYVAVSNVQGCVRACVYTAKLFIAAALFCYIII